MEPVTEEQPTTEMSRVMSGEEYPLLPADAPQEPEHSSTILDKIVARREEMAHEDHELILDVPGYRMGAANRLAVRYCYPDEGWKAMASIARRAAESRNEDAIMLAMIDVLVACCDEVLTRDDNGEPVRLDPDADAPLRFGPRLAGMLQIEIPEDIKGKARFVCRRLFSPGFPDTGQWKGDYALIRHSQAVQEWLQDLYEQTGEDFSGE